MISEKDFENLKKAIGKNVTVKYVEYGSPKVEIGKLKEVAKFEGVTIGNIWMPFIGYGYAVQNIIDENGNMLYQNKLIQDDYDIRDSDQIDKVRALSFGKNVAEKMRNERLEYERKLKERWKKRDKKAKQEFQKYLKEGLSLVRDDKKEEWEEYVKRNIVESSELGAAGYNAAVIRASLYVMKALSEGKPPEEAEKEMFKEEGLTGFQSGCVAWAVSYFHPYGEEFRKHWNKKWGVSEHEKGVANPAVWKME